jgi:hypothetical protein
VVELGQTGRLRFRGEGSGFPTNRSTHFKKSIKPATCSRLDRILKRNLFMRSFLVLAEAVCRTLERLEQSSNPGDPAIAELKHRALLRFAELHEPELAVGA